MEVDLVYIEGGVFHGVLILDLIVIDVETLFSRTDRYEAIHSKVASALIYQFGILAYWKY